MDERVLAAAENHAAWCDLACRSRGIATAMDDDHWVALQRPPDRIPDVVTLLPSADAEAVLQRAQDGPGCAVTDSFARLDLGRLGFEEIAGAQWVHRPPALPTVTAAAIWSVVETEEELDAWALASGREPTFGPQLLRDDAVRVLAARGRLGVRAGAVASRSGSVVGVIDVFTTKAMDDVEAWATLPTAIAGFFFGLPLVGWVGPEQREAALVYGFVETGPLRVWRRP
jgi:hypothetical protein